MKSNFIFHNDSDHEEPSTQDVNKLVKQEDPRKGFKQPSEDQFGEEHFEYMQEEEEP
jgi:hypothetical protein